MIPTRAWLHRSALDAMLEETLARAPLETGGMLLGYRPTETDDVVITEVTGPGPGAHHGRRRFRPDGRWQQRRLAEAYASSGRITTFVGDWHCHPDEHPVPSRRDLRTARRTSRRKAARAPHPAMIIVGVEEGQVALGVYVLVDDALRDVDWTLFGE